MNEKIELTGVPETMLQTLYARAKESRTRGAVTDKKAEEIIEKLDYDFSLAEWGLQLLSGFLSWLCHGWSLLFAHRHRKKTVNFLDCPLGLGMKL